MTQQGSPRGKIQSCLTACGQRPCGGHFIPTTHRTAYERILLEAPPARAPDTILRETVLSSPPVDHSLQKKHKLTPK